jgi:CRISPR-associated protein Csc2
MRNVKLNAIQDTTAGGIAGSAFATRENVLPQIFIPTVETLLDVTATEFAYVLGNILKTTRYGAESNREGFIRNHILGIYFSDVELFSNLELTQYYYDALIDPEEKALPEYLSLDQFASTWSEVEKRTLNRVVGQNKKVENIDALLDGIRTLYGDEKLLQPFLRSLVMDALAYEKIQNPPKNAGKNRKNKKASSEEEQFEEEDTSEEEDV